MENMDYVKENTARITIQYHLKRIRLFIEFQRKKAAINDLYALQFVPQGFDTSVLIWEIEAHGFENNAYIGFIEVRNFSYSDGKMQKMHYLLTKKGLKMKLRLTYYFLKTKEAEYNIMKKEWEKLISKK